MKQIFYLVLMFSLLLGACREDTIIDDTTVIIPDTTAEFDTNLKGRVLDEDGNALVGVEIAANGVQTTSNDHGFFTLEVSAASTGLHIKADKKGYFTGGITYFSSGPSTDVVRQIILSEKTYENFHTDNGISISNDLGYTVTIPAGLLALDGSPYEGEVQIATKWLDPTARTTTALMPGALLGLTTEGEEAYLQTYGMIAVEMEDMSGNELNLGEGQTADLVFPLESELIGQGPDEIQLWFFDESEGIWVEEGVAQKTDIGYETAVSHFSWWNCDDPFPVAGLCLTVLDANSDPVYNLDYCLEFNSNLVCEHYYGDNKICGLVPADQIMELSIYDECNTLLHSQSVGPYSTGFGYTDEVVSVTLPADYDLVTVSGAVADCNGANINQGVVIGEHEGRSYFDFDISDGSYELTFVNCVPDEVSTLDLLAIDFVGGEEGSVALSIEPNVLTYTTDLTACGNAVLVNQMLIGDENLGPLVFEECVVYMTAAETTVVATPDPLGANGPLGPVILGFKGFSTGVFSGNLISGGNLTTPSAQGELDAVSIEILEYGPVGGNIRGVFSFGSTTGSFVAERKR